MSIADITPTIQNKIEEALWSSSLDLVAAQDIGKLRFRVNFNGEMLMTSRGKTPELVDLREN
ncbi:MAG: hypothetical protein ACFKPT_04675 [Gloeotrichia echinulata GP01]